MRPALYRSVVFWLWVFVLGFLLWAWVDSRTTRTVVSRMWFLESPMAGYKQLHAIFTNGMKVGGGRIELAWVSDTITDPMMSKRYAPVQYRRAPTEYHYEREWFARPVVSRHVNEDTMGAKVVVYQVVVPMWGVVGCYLVFGGGLLLWRRRRVRGANIEHRTPNIE